jgi:S1-C subfamily serine protease
MPSGPCASAAIPSFLPRFPFRTAVLAGLWIGALISGAIGTQAAEEAASLDDLLAAVVQIESEIPAKARTADVLGTERDGSGVVIGADGLILTIGYLVLEARQVTVITHDGQRMPASVVGYDPYTGFGLVRSLKPIAAKPPAFGNSSALKREDPLLVVSGAEGEGGRIQSAILVSSRTFAGYWEYLLEQALFTSPPVNTYAGAALFDRNLKLVGIGSLFVRDATDGMEIPGNMFVPIDAAGPVLPNLIRHGRAPGPARPWMGVNVIELFDHVLITRVNPESPADRAGLRPGDIVVEVAGKPVASMEQMYRALWALGNAGVSVPLKVLQKNALRELRVQSVDRHLYYRSAAD